MTFHFISKISYNNLLVGHLYMNYTTFIYNHNNFENIYVNRAKKNAGYIFLKTGRAEIVQGQIFYDSLKVYNQWYN